VRNIHAVIKRKKRSDREGLSSRVQVLDGLANEDAVGVTACALSVDMALPAREMIGWPPAGL
jgi:hypothetical protein